MSRNRIVSHFGKLMNKEISNGLALTLVNLSLGKNANWSLRRSPSLFLKSPVKTNRKVLNGI